MTCQNSNLKTDPKVKESGTILVVSYPEGQDDIISKVRILGLVSEMNLVFALTDNDQFEIYHSTISGKLIFYQAVFSGIFGLQTTKVSEGLVFTQAVVLPEYGAIVSWRDFQHIGAVNKIDTEPDRYLESGDALVMTFFEPQEMNTEGDVYVYDNLMAYHKRFHTYFQERGDIKSANACYVAMRSLEEHFLRAQYQAQPNLSNWFRWRMNQFLKVFSAYGTDPSQALIAAFYIIVLFGGIYILFPSETDNLYRRQLLIKRESMNSKRRSASWWAVWVAFIGWGVFMRIINAVALSANAFVTLGYGEIQAEGISRYLAVLEGLLGWFLLAIFSVSLIGQIMQ